MRLKLFFSCAIACCALAGILLVVSPALAGQGRLFTGSFGGAFSTTVDPYPLGSAGSISVDTSSGPSSGDIYVADSKYHRVEKFDSAGHFMLMFGGGVVAAGVEGTGDLTAGSNEVTSVVATERTFLPSEEVTGVGISAGTTIVSVGVGTLTLSKAVTVSGTKVALSVAEGAGNLPNNEQQRITLEHNPTGGSFRLTFTSAAFEGTNANGSEQVSATHEVSGSLHVGDSVGLVSAEGLGDRTAGSTVVSKVNAGVGGGGVFTVGAPIEGRGIPAGTTIVAVGSETLTLSAPATQSITQSQLDAYPKVAAIDASTGSFTLSTPSLHGASESLHTASETTTAIAYNASAGEVQGALEALAAIGVGDVAVSGAAGGPWTVEFKGALSDADVPQLAVDAIALTPATARASTTMISVGHSAAEVCDTNCQPGSAASTPGAFEASSEQSRELFVAADSSAGLSTGDVYVGATTTGGEGSVTKFDEAGQLVSTWGSGGQITSSNSLPLGAVKGLTVDPSGNLWIDGTSGKGLMFDLMQDATFIRDWPVKEVSGPLAVDSEGHVYLIGGANENEVHKYTSTGEQIALITQIGTNSSSGRTGPFALDPSSDSIFQGATAHNSTTPVLDRYEASCQEEGFSGCVPVETFTSSHFQMLDARSGGLAVDPTSALDTIYDAHSDEVAMFSIETLPDVATQPASGFTSTSATLNGTVDPDGVALTECYFEWGEGTGSYEHTAECEEPDAAKVGSGGKSVAVHAHVPIQPAKSYHFRLVVANSGQVYEPSRGSDVVFGPPLVDSTSVLQITDESATFQAEIDPRNVNTEYHFEYLSETEFNENGQSFKGIHPAVSVPQSDMALGVGEEDLLGTVHIRGLAPQTTYRYRVVAHNLLGEGAEAVYGPTESFQTWGTGTFGLPDGRQWEMVSSPAKEGALVEPIGEDWVIQSAADGGRMAYVARTATEADPQGALVYQSVLATRGSGGGWSSRDLSVPHAGATTLSVGQGWEYRFFSEDLSRAIVQPLGAFTPCVSTQGEAQPCVSPHASEQTAFLDSLYAGGEGSRESCSSSCFTPLVTGAEGYADVPSHTVFGQISYDFDKSCPPSPICGPKFLYATPDASHVVLGSHVALTPSPAAGKAIPPGGLYEWSEDDPASEQLRLVSVLPGNAKGEALPAEAPVFGLKTENRNVRRAISDDGSRVVWGSGAHLYLRENSTQPQSPLGPSGECLVPTDGCTVQLDAGLSAQATFQTADTEDTRIFFTDGGDLFVYEVQGGKLVALTNGGGLVGAAVGASEDGSWIYYAGNGALVPGAAEGKCETSGSCNLYVSHYGAGEWEAPKLIAVLSGLDSTIWGGSSLELKYLAARISSNGQWLAFMSQRSLTGYDNSDALSGEPDQEVYEYDAQTESLTCASCNPSGSRPHGLEGSQIEGGHGGIAGGSLFLSGWVAANLPPWTPNSLSGSVYQSRYLSDSGRLFFDSADALVAKDINGVEDAYEFEPEGVPGGEHACESSSTSGSVVFKPTRETEVESRRVREGAGCVALISSGESPQESAFLDATETGSEVFFITTGKLFPEDVDSSYDVYDARECTQQSPCAPAPAARPPACTTEASCRPAPAPQPEIFGPSGSQTFSGPGNLAPPVPVAPVIKKVKPSTRRQKLNAALKACHEDRVKLKRKRCEKAALRRYGGAKGRSGLRRTSNVNRGRRAK